MGPRFEVWSHGGDHAGWVVIDPFSVVAVHEKVMDKPGGGGAETVAVIHLHDGSQWEVFDTHRDVAAIVWAGKSVIIP